ncbi:GNAT family N-acetyltransferase [Blastococcus xanthinilyticus]|uniref:Putative acetyltransferase n=1 Tax=Blastococcus xanthinilyticus TaxID=1564164 RepID=A0A5S5CZX7_9ACTN|nr:N-acetyltransferase [Blastococcus xanthinilyticus]TYP88426.1 putative acetyltransferase [Blastococcus xanthinilyticus]
MIVRRERPADHAAVGSLHMAAFARDPATGAVRAADDVPEARLVEQLRNDPGFLPHLSLVAVDGGDVDGGDVDGGGVDGGGVAGHVIATRGWLEPFGTAVLGLGPLAVRPDRQGHGIGTVLVHALVAVAEAAGERLVALLGSPDYYRRFGFVPADIFGVSAPDPRWARHFQARLLDGPALQGTFRYADPFTRL